MFNLMKKRLLTLFKHNFTKLFFKQNIK